MIPLSHSVRVCRLIFEVRHSGGEFKISPGKLSLGPLALHRAAIGYDETTAYLDQQLLLLNIARKDSDLAVHFTTTSSIAATFDWTTTIGVVRQLEESPGTDFWNFNIGASASENPTFSIVPISREEFTKRILTPFKADSFEFLVYQ